ncbi:c-type cytochrome [Sedimentitalea todarodis]|uniref:C-type cytochrome n=1 Tax=Sedimentitalea todarodis TaxID=1631240 RepID=A0ABU3VH82_9RHOB|nr:c-type cytochrome [Sedimentitalea todarodis]MDU9005520.1 c-type cytochrome [Sedimentitalea todarodis]
MFMAGAAWANEFGDPKKGADVFKKCSSCHQIGEGARSRVGPQLNGVFGRTAGTLVGARYSQNMTHAGDEGLVWTQKTLDAYIENPRALVSKTRMDFGGISDPVERSHLLAYLRAYSDDPANIPEAEPTATGTDHELDPAILAIVGDPEYGEYLASECTTCHQVSGADSGIPAIRGWPTKDFVVAMHAYKRKLRPHPVMQMMAGRLSDEEIAAIAAYYNDLE